VRCANASPGYRSLIVDGDITVGRVTAGAWSPSLNAGIGYARFDIPGEWEGRSLHLVLEDGRRLECEIVRLPFLDPEKRIPRGLPLDGD
jgi:aminomethyltransferase